MRATKDSGVDWLGEVPAKWETSPLRTLMKLRNERNTFYRSDNYLSLMANVGIIPYAEKGDVGNKAPEDLGKCKIVSEGDFVVNSMNFGIGSFGVSAYNGVCSSVYVVMEPRLEKAFPSFLRYIFSMQPFQKHVQSLGNGILEHRAAIGWDELKNIGFPMPDLDEQRRIADFLDRETAKIDALIAKQEQLITTLDERRGAVLRTLVTRGHREDVALKPASAPWLYGALIPAHWVEAPLSTFLTLKSGSSITSESIEEEGDYPVFGGGGFRGYTDTFTNEGDFVLIGRVGALCGNIKRATGKFYASEHSLVSYPKVPMSQGWLAAILETMNLGQYSKASAQPVISVGGIGRVKAPFPPHEEQLAIDSRLQEAIASIEALSVRTAATAALLKERRQGLISAAVTGKLEVGV